MGDLKITYLLASEDSANGESLRLFFFSIVIYSIKIVTLKKLSFGIPGKFSNHFLEREILTHTELAKTLAYTIYYSTTKQCYSVMWYKSQGRNKTILLFLTIFRVFFPINEGCILFR